MCFLHPNVCQCIRGIFTIALISNGWGLILGDKTSVALSPKIHYFLIHITPHVLPPSKCILDKGVLFHKQ
jgi:hypothetical protein